MNRLFFVVILFLFVGAVEAFACRWVRLSPCEFYDRASAIFLGQNITKNEQGNITFRVIEAFKGVEGKTIQVELRGTVCGAVAMPKESVLVFATKDEKGKLVARNCGYVRAAGLNEGYVAYLRKMDKANGGRLYGEVKDSLSHYTLKKAPPEVFDQIRIRISNGSQEHILKLNDNHAFEITGLKPTAYTVELLLPENCISFGGTIQKIEIKDKGCGEVQFSFCLEEAAPPPKSNESPKNKPPK